MQAQGTAGHPRLYKSPWDATKVTFQTEGPKGFYKGLGPTLLKVFLVEILHEKGAKD